MKTSSKVNFEKLKQMILSEKQESMEIEESRIRRTKSKDIITVQETKIFRITGPKRKHEREHGTLPFGYTKKQKLTKFTKVSLL